MKIILVAVALAFMFGSAFDPAQQGALKTIVPTNPMIDVDQFRVDVDQAMSLRERRLLPEKEFMWMALNPETVVLDARSRDKYAMLHVEGAKNLPFTDFTESELAAVIPFKSTPVLIYCNNNFTSQPVAFAAKYSSAALNLSTFTSLVSYGYTNVYELGDLVDPAQTKLKLVPSTGDRK